MIRTKRFPEAEPALSLSPRTGFIMAMGVAWPVLLGAEESGPSIDERFIASRVPSAETGFEGDHMTGDWRGLRTRMVDRGFHFSFGYSGEVFGNLSGGKKRGVEYEGLLELGLDVDFSKFSFWQGASGHISGLYPHGASPSGQLVGDLSTVSNIDAYDSFSLFEWWIEQRFFEERLALRLGQLAADEEFAISEYSGTFLNAAFGWPSFISLNAPAPAFPVAALGTSLRWNLDDSFFAQGGIFDGNPDPGDSAGRPMNRHGTRIKLNRDEGAFAILEMGFDFRQRPENADLPGEYKLGAWYHTAEFDHLRKDESGLSLANPASDGIPEALDGNWGFYAIADQMLWRERSEGEAANQGLGMFTRIGGSPADRSLVEFNLEFGFHYQGLLPGRNEDVAGLGLVWLDMSDDAGRLAKESGDAELDYEVALEATYQIRIQPWWLIQPDAQYIIHPGGSSRMENALIVGMRSSLIF